MMFEQGDVFWVETDIHVPAKRGRRGEWIPDSDGTTVYVDHVEVTDVDNVGGTSYAIAYYGTGDEYIADDWADADTLIEYFNDWDVTYS